MTGVLYEETFGVFLLVTILLGGSAGWLTGRAAAQTWRPLRQVVYYSFLLGAAVRFIHYSLFDGTLLSPHFYLIDTAVCLVLGVLGFRARRTAQMTRQYRWINETAGLLRWRRKSA
jgi:DMSO/TMAO reductase YedYZ heme-binding membrane subunit